MEENEGASSSEQGETGCIRGDFGFCIVMISKIAVKLVCGWKGSTAAETQSYELCLQASKAKQMNVYESLKCDALRI